MILRLIAFWAAICAIQSVHAGLIVIEPDDFSIGQEITSPFATVSIVSVSGNGPITHEAATPYLHDECPGEWCRAGTGELSFGPTFEAQSYFNWLLDPEHFQAPSSFRAVRVDFTRQVHSVSVIATYNWDFPDLYAFNRYGEFIGSCGAMIVRDGCSPRYLESAPDDPSREEPSWTNRILMEFTHPDISYVVFAGWSATVDIDTISYRVPEPASIALLSLGLAGMVATRRRNSRA